MGYRKSYTPMFCLPQHRIAFVLNSFWYAHRFRIGFMRSLRDAGAQVYVIAPNSPDDQPARAALQAEGFHVVPYTSKIYTTSIWHDVQFILELWRIYRTFSFDLCLHYTIKPNIYGAIAAFLTNTPCIAITTGLGILKQLDKRFSGNLLCLFYRLASRLSKEVWFLNQEDRAFFLSKGLTTPSKTFVLQGEGIDLEYFQPQPKPPRPPDAPLQLLFIGRLLRSKGLLELRQAAAYFRNRGQAVSIHVLGFPVDHHPDGIPIDTILRWQRTYDLHYLGYSEDIRPFLAQADALVLPSYGEGMSRVILEACSMAIPVIASDVPGCRELVIDGKNGFLCSPADTRSLIKAIERLRSISDSGRVQLGRAGRLHIQQGFEQISCIEAFRARLAPFLHTRQPSFQKLDTIQI